MLVQDVSDDFTLQSHHFIFTYSWTSLQRPPWGQEKVTVAERLKQGWIYGLSAKKHGHSREVATLETRRRLGRVNFRKDFWDCY